MANEHVKYWDNFWGRHIEAEDVIIGNPERYKRIINFIWNRPQYFKLNKLDVGCGTCQYVFRIRNYTNHYVNVNNWRGVDLSKVAVKYAQSKGLRAKQADFLEWDTPLKFECFTFWNSLEYFEDITRVAHKIDTLADKYFSVQGNVPLYKMKTNTDGSKRFLDIRSMSAFWDRLGLFNREYEVYGIDGYPYLLFEANNFQELSKTIEDLA